MELARRHEEVAPEPLPFDLAEAARTAERPAEPPRRHLDAVPEWTLPNAFRLIEIDDDPVEVAARCGADSPEVAELCRRGYVRIAMPPLDRCASETVRRLWDTLEAIDSRAVRQFGDRHDRETYHRDKAAWEAVFYEHVRRSVL